MDFDLSQTSHRATYNLIIGLVTPRPIALITSLDLNGRVNAAPFSAYNFLGTDPAVVAIGAGNRPGPGIIGKDTAQNIRNAGEASPNGKNFMNRVMKRSLPRVAPRSTLGRGL